MKKETVTCPRCGSDNVEARGNLPDGRKKYKCKNCEKKDHKKYFHETVPLPVGARILLFDIETAPMEVYVWSLRGNDYITPDKIIKDWSILCWSARWLFEPDEEKFGRGLLVFFNKPRPDD